MLSVRDDEEDSINREHGTLKQTLIKKRKGRYTTVDTPIVVGLTAFREALKNVFNIVMSALPRLMFVTCLLQSSYKKDTPFVNPSA